MQVCLQTGQQLWRCIVFATEIQLYFKELWREGLGDGDAEGFGLIEGLTLGDMDSDTDGDIDWAIDGLGLIEYGLEATDELTLGIGLDDNDSEGEAGREYGGEILWLTEYGEATGELCKYGRVVATPDKTEP